MSTSSDLQPFRLRVEEQMHAFTALHGSSVHCYVVILMIGRLPIVIVIDVLATHCRGGAGKDGRRHHLSNSCSLSVLAAPWKV